MALAGLAAVAWNNGAHHQSGAGYGLKISAADRDAWLKREWASVELHLPAPHGLAIVNIDKPSFWNETCRELIDQQIGAWLISEGKGRWARGKPPRVKLLPRGERVFEVVPAWKAN
jgi:hypothetical protein